jgi:signal transduction histidine kinase
MFQKTHPFGTRLAVAVLVMGLAFLMTAIVNPAIKGQTTVILLSGTIFCALFGGLGLGLGAAVLAALGHNYFFQRPTMSFAIATLEDGFDLILFIFMAVFMSWVGSLLRDAKLDAERSRREAEKTTDAMEKTLALISHDIRNPLAAAKMIAELALRRQTPAESFESTATKVVANLERADKMLRGLLDAHRIHAGQELQLEFETCDLTNVISATLGELNTLYVHRLRFQLSGPIFGRWSADGMRRALENLVTNALKYGDPTAPVWILLKTTDQDVTLSVHNEGKPIPESMCKKLFEPYFRGSEKEGSSQPGWGIGLSVVKGVASAHGGSVSVESSPEKGTTFTLFFPGALSQELAA